MIHLIQTYEMRFAVLMALIGLAVGIPFFRWIDRMIGHQDPFPAMMAGISVGPILGFMAGWFIVGVVRAATYVVTGVWA